MSLSTTQYGYIVDPMVPFTDDKGKTIKNGFIRVFMAGTSTPVLTYRNYDGATNQEKIELDNSGRVKYNVIGSKGSLYKVVVYDAHHSQETPILTVDKIAVLGASINATGATIVTGLDSVTVQGENFLKATVEGTGVELALDPMEVTSELSTTAAAVTAAPDYVVPLLDKTGEGDSKKISLANLFKFALDWISRLATTIPSFASGDVIAVSNPTDGTRKMSKDTLLTLTAQNALAGNVAHTFDPNRTSENLYKAGECVVYTDNKLYRFRVDHYGPWNAQDVVETTSVTEVLRVDTTWIRGKFINALGNEMSNVSYEASDYIAIPPSGLRIVTKLFNSTTISYYDKNKTFVGYHTEDSSTNVYHEEVATTSTFEGALYVRISNILSNTDRGAWIANTPYDISDLKDSLVNLSDSLVNLSNSIEKEFSTEKNYSAGEVVLNNDNVLYKFFADHPAGAWTGSDSVETNVERESNRVDKLWTQGYRIHPNGSPVAGDGYEYSDYIVIPEDGLFVSCHLFSYSCIAFYDASKNFIGSHGVESGSNILHEETLTRNAFEGAAYIRVTNYYRGYKGRGVWRASIENSQSAVSRGFVPTKKYLAGENAVVNGNLIRFFADHEPGNFDGTDAVSTIVTNEINRVDSKWIQGYYLNFAGTENALSGYEYSDYIVIPYNGLKVTTSVFASTGIAYYNASKQFVGFKAGTGAANSVQEFVVTREDFENSVYIRVDNYRGSSTGSYNLRRVNTLNLMYNVNTESNEYCRYTGGEASTFNKGVAIGDSLTSGTFNYDYPDGQLIHVIEDAKYSWPTFFKKLSGVDMTNKGHGGTTPESWYASHSSDDLSGHDFAIIALGVNCAFHDHGGWTSDSDQALKDIITKLENENEGIKIFVCTTFKSTAYTGEIFDEISEGIRESVADIQTNDENVFLLDHHEYGTTGLTRYWHGHATATGYERIAEDLFGYISYIMSQDMDKFKYIQFIGTQYNP